MPDIQQQTDVEKAREKLGEVNRQKEVVSGANLPSPALTPGREKAQKSIRPVAGKPKKKSFGQKLKEAMFGNIEDTSIGEHIFFNIFVPSIKRVLSDMGNTALNMALGLDPKTRTFNAGNTHVANASVYRDRNLNRSISSTPGYGRREAVSEFYWDEETAKDIYNQISDLIDQFGYATLADAYAIMDMSSKIRSTDGDWGWRSMKNAEVYPIDNSGERWVVDMPPAKPL